MNPSSSTPQNPSEDAIQRVLFIASNVHVYTIPPLTTTKGYLAAHWTAENNKRRIFTARLRVLETAIPDPDGSGESLSTNILLEDPSTGELFAGAPYTDSGAVEAALDSVRFFVVRVVGDGGRKAMLGIGFEERSEAIDFGITLQEVRKVQKIDPDAAGKKLGTGPKEEKIKAVVTERKDFSLKEGETIHVDIGRKGRRKNDEGNVGRVEDGRALFSIPPPPYSSKEGIGGGIPFIPPPPSAQDVKAERRRSRQPELAAEVRSVSDLGFDDGEFGEFQ
ncbi:hypothetical protein MMC31_007737 [Peltigera leucophlebia]|nr:hypothetical protein [Peltigera leucophlebia]